MAIRSEVYQRLEKQVHARMRRLSGKGKLRGLFRLREDSLQRPHTALVRAVKTATAQQKPGITARPRCAIHCALLPPAARAGTQSGDYRTRLFFSRRSS